MSNGTQNKIDCYRATDVATPTYDLPQTSSKINWSRATDVSVKKEPQIKKAVGFWESFADGFTEDMSFGLIDMTEDADAYATKKGSYGQIGGMFTSMMFQAAALSAVTFGVGGVTLFMARGAKIANAAKKYNKAKKL